MADFTTAQLGLLVHLAEPLFDDRNGIPRQAGEIAERAHVTPTYVRKELNKLANKFGIPAGDIRERAHPLVRKALEAGIRSWARVLHRRNATNS